MYSKLRQIPEDQWGEIAAPVTIALTPYGADEFSEKFGFHLFEYEEDGLGLVRACVVELANTKYWLASYTFSPEPSVDISILSYELDSQNALEKILPELDLTIEKLMWIREGLGPAQWVLYRVDDNANEVEMHRFQEEFSAQWVMEKYREKAQEQTYFVTKVL